MTDGAAAVIVRVARSCRNTATPMFFHDALIGTLTFPGFTRDVESFKTFLKQRGQSAAPSVAMLGK